MKRTTFFIFVLLLAFHLNARRQSNSKMPNVILVLTDDQGIGDLSCHGNPWLHTPNIDHFHDESVRLTDFHVSPLCAPTRGAIMTGQYPINNGVWATYKGRDALSEGATTLADIFKQNGYTTAMFGKWHLGDNYPSRPTDLGFDYAIQHKAGGVGELSDYWGNSYFDDVYYVNNEPKQFSGYCTDVWFSEAIKFIDKNKDKPFFVYIPTNAPHDPWRVDKKYAEPFKELEAQKKIVSANFYGMIVNIDQNFGRLNQYLKDNDLDDNTIVIFMTDNGSSGGISRDGNTGYNYGFRGMKGGKTEGGHRVPFFIRWPAGKIGGGKDIPNLSTHVDILPTLADLCSLEVPKDKKLDGIDLTPLLYSKAEDNRRKVFIHHRQDWRPPFDVDQTCVLQGNWRLVNGNQLYDVSADRHQDHNLAAQYPDSVLDLLNAEKAFVSKAKQLQTYNEFPANVVGNPAQEEIKLTIQHAIGEDRGIWKSEQVAEGMKNVNDIHVLKIDREGIYEIRCCRWPKECPGPIWGVPAKNPKNMYVYKTIKPEKVSIKIANQIHEKEVDGDKKAVTFRVHLEKGKTLLVNDFIEGNEKYGVYYTYVKFLGAQ